MTKTTALEEAFPISQVSRVAEQESWRKEVNRPLYHIHKWWATRLGSVFRAITLAALSPQGTDTWAQFYVRHNLKDKVVLDPFMGSGTTLGEALKLGAKAVGCDVNPVSTFLVRQAFADVSEARLQSQFKRLEAEVAPQIRLYFQTPDRETGDQIRVLYYFWVKVLETPDGEKIPLLSKWVFSQDAYPKKKPLAQILCSSCWTVFSDRYDSVAATCSHCRTTFNPQVGPAVGQYVESKTGIRYRIKDLLPKDAPPNHRMYALMAVRENGTKVYLTPDEHDHALYASAARRLTESSLPLPTMVLRPGHNTDQARNYGYVEWRQFFNDRQLLCHGLLLDAILRIEDIEVQEQFLCLFSSTLEFNNLFCSFKGEGTGAVRHMFSNHILKPERTPLENSIWGTDKSSGTFSTLFESRLLRAKRYLKEPFELSLEEDLIGGKATSSKVVASAPLDVEIVDDWAGLKKSKRGVLILNGDSSQLPVPDKSVDAVITDPPYFDFVHYSELSDFFFAWLSPVLKSRYGWFDKQDSSNDGEVQQKDPREFARLLGSVFSESARVLKDDGVLAFSFHHSREEGWAAIYEALKIAGLAVVAVHPVHAELRAASPKTAAKAPISLDAILVCKKQSHALAAHYGDWDVVGRSKELAEELVASGLSLSTGDWFVIGASQALIASGKENFTFEQSLSHLADVRKRVSEVT